jgi:hypothetical protein
MTLVPSLPLSCVRTEYVDHGTRRCVPYETSDTRWQGCRTRYWPRASERSVVDLPKRTILSTPRRQELVDPRCSALFSPLTRANNSHSRLSVPV